MKFKYYPTWQGEIHYVYKWLKVYPGAHAYKAELQAFI